MAAKKKPRRHDYRNATGNFAKRPPALPAAPPPNATGFDTQQQAYVAGATPGWWISDHAEELRHFVSWIYVGVHKIAQQWAQSKVCVYDDAQEEDEYEKALRDLPPRTLALAKMCKAWRTKSHTPDTAAEQETPLQDHPALDLLEHPNPYTSGRVFRYQVACQIRLTGGAYIWEVPGVTPSGMNTGPAHLWVLPRGWVRPMAPTGPYPNGYFQVTPIFNTFTMGVVSPTQSAWNVPFEQMICVGWPDPLYPGEFKSPLAACSQILDVMEQMDTATLAGMINAVKPSMVFNIDPRNGQTVTKEMLDQFTNEVTKLKAGANNAGKILTMMGLSAQPMMTGPSDLDYVNGRDQARKNTLGIQGVNEIVAGMSGAGSYSEAAVGAKSTIEFSVEPDLAMYSDTLTHRWQGTGFLSPTQRIEHTAHAYDDPTLTLQKTDKVAAGFTAGVVSANEYRASLDLSPLPDPIADIPAVLLQPMIPEIGAPETGIPGAEGDDPYAAFASDSVDTEDDMPTETGTGMKRPELQEAGKMLRFSLPGLLGEKAWQESKHPRVSSGPHGGEFARGGRGGRKPKPPMALPKGHHEMTRAEFIRAAKLSESYGGGRELTVNGARAAVYTRPVAGTTEEIAGRHHRRVVEETLQQGGKVPSEVLADYPDLQPKEDTPSQAAAIASIQEMLENPNVAYHLQHNPTHPGIVSAIASDYLRKMNVEEVQAVTRWLKREHPALAAKIAEVFPQHWHESAKAFNGLCLNGTH